MYSLSCMTKSPSTRIWIQKLPAYTTHNYDNLNIQPAMDHSASLPNLVSGSTVFDYNALPECASSCKILEASEANCVPPAAPVSNHFTYQDCVCQSAYLGDLHESGAICHEVCSDDDDKLIHQYYNRMCGQSDIPETTTSHLPSTTTLPTVTLPTLTTVYTTLVTMQTPTTSAPPPTQTHVDAIEDQGSWLQQNRKYFAIIGGGLALLIGMIMICIHLYKRHNRKSALENAGRRHPFILLQDVSPLQNKTPPRSQPVTPIHQPSPLHPHSSPEGNLSYPSSSPGLSYPPPTLTFGPTIRTYASDSQNDLHEMQRAAGRCGTPCRSLSRTERLIMERIRMTGRPDIPMSATPKVERGKRD
ncbi:hypothetical protein COCMIDRAFT_28091 [Bipolaris oryzae ATCC 44560]|uniref:Uncharacterized protein n=1 Tax=Bipolaris oryzae ATCC 44560 TaxID=930090 RepID=W6Z157_COCMI|nr:uncharacterized protein COCMIDRAFT_28091 [Bipolaris oryzae ATCC 44560]EUC43433.1 hypothetical protein COCMIDRAFT_28091 [Bipolaris oryzae ATCC 44560]